MKFILSTTVLASVMAPAAAFSYLDSLGGGVAVNSAPAPSNGASYMDSLNGVAPAAPAAAAPAPAAEPYVSGFGEVELAATSAGYLDSMNIGSEISGPGMMTHVETLNTGSALPGGAGIQSYAGTLPVQNSLDGGAGIQTYAGGLSPADFSGASYSPFGESATATFSGSTSADGVSFTLETGDISGLVQNLGAGGTLRLTGTIDNISY